MPQTVYLLRFRTTGEAWQTLIAANSVVAAQYVERNGYTEIAASFDRSLEYRKPVDRSQTVTVTPMEVIE